MHIVSIFAMVEANRKMDTGKTPYGNNTHRHPELPSQSFWNPQFQLGRASEGPLIALSRLFLPPAFTCIFEIFELQTLHCRLASLVAL
jgi:hypothetical protein